MRFRTIEVRRDPACPLCGTREQTSLIDYDAFCGLRPESAAEVLPLEIEPRALAARLSAGAPPRLIDVREAWEFAIAALPGAELVPGSVLARGAAAIPRDREIVLYCHSGMRSAHWLNALRAQGYERISHLRGGIDAWSTQVDPSVPRY
jgi:rhodanese-related sulfurtransferase